VPAPPISVTVRDGRLDYIYGEADADPGANRRGRHVQRADPVP